MCLPSLIKTLKKLPSLILAITFSTIAFFFSCKLVERKASGQKLETVYLNPKDSAVNVFIAVKPDDIPVKAFMFCIPGMFETPQDVLRQTDLPFYASKQGILTIIPTFATGISSFGIDSLTQRSLRKMLDLIISKYNLQQKDFFIGGLSIGGTCAVKYAELAVQNNYSIRPKAVFSIDPPLDFERFYNSEQRIMRLSVNTKPNAEVSYIIDRIQNEMQGTPQTAIQTFYRLSPYSMSDTTQRAVKTLIDMPIRFITEPDIHWWLSQRGNDYTNMNAIDEAGMINELQRLGNDKAIIITTHNKRYRNPGNRRHPHSWSIADPEKLVNWLEDQM